MTLEFDPYSEPDELFTLDKPKTITFARDLKRSVDLLLFYENIKLQERSHQFVNENGYVVMAIAKQNNPELTEYFVGKNDKLLFALLPEASVNSEDYQKTTKICLVEINEKVHIGKFYTADVQELQELDFELQDIMNKTWRNLNEPGWDTDTQLTEMYKPEEAFQLIQTDSKRPPETWDEDSESPLPGETGSQLDDEAFHFDDAHVQEFVADFKALSNLLLNEKKVLISPSEIELFAHGNFTITFSGTKTPTDSYRFLIKKDGYSVVVLQSIRNVSTPKTDLPNTYAMAFAFPEGNVLVTFLTRNQQLLQEMEDFLESCRESTWADVIAPEAVKNETSLQKNEAPIEEKTKEPVMQRLWKNFFKSLLGN